MRSAALAAIVFTVALLAGGAAQAATTSESATLEEVETSGLGAGTARFSVSTQRGGVLALRLDVTVRAAAPEIEGTPGRFVARPLRIEAGLATLWPAGDLDGVLNFDGAPSAGAVTYTRPLRRGTNRFTIRLRVRGRGDAVVVRGWDEWYGGDAVPLIAVARPTP